jgi:hypothetical protein
MFRFIVPPKTSSPIGFLGRHRLRRSDHRYHRKEIENAVSNFESQRNRRMIVAGRRRAKSLRRGWEGHEIFKECATPFVKNSPDRLAPHPIQEAPGRLFPPRHKRLHAVRIEHEAQEVAWLRPPVFQELNAGKSTGATNPENVTASQISAPCNFRQRTR